MSVLGPIVETLVRPAIEAGCHVRLRRTVPAQFIGDDPLWNKAILIHRTPEPELLSSAFHNDLVQTPNIARARLSLPQIAGNPRSELGDPTADCLIGNVDPTLKQHFLNFAQAQIEPQVKRQPGMRSSSVTSQTTVLTCGSRSNRHAPGRL
nr:hypothetical protein [Marinicella sp. W31]MDC2875570.1 hypothetical protein [Marinicella sp. W31]